MHPLLIVIAVLMLPLIAYTVRNEISLRAQRKEINSLHARDKERRNELAALQKRGEEYIRVDNKRDGEMAQDILRLKSLVEVMVHREEGTFDPATFKEMMGLFQKAWANWMQSCFADPEHADLNDEASINDPGERNRRFLEESLELVQSLNFSKAEAHFMVDYVYGRPVGEPTQEAAGALATLVVLCNTHKIKLGDVSVDELDSCWGRIQQIREKQAKKPKYEDVVRKIPDWNETNIQMAVVLATTGNPLQQEEARTFFVHHLDYRNSKQNG